VLLRASVVSRVDDMPVLRLQDVVRTTRRATVWRAGIGLRGGAESKTLLQRFNPRLVLISMLHRFGRQRGRNPRATGRWARFDTIVSSG